MREEIEMDNLAKEAMLALQASMSYGKWKALHQEVRPKVKKKIPEGWRACEHCGKLFKRKGAQRFCDAGCRNEAYRDKERAINTEYRRRQREKRGL